MLNRYLVLNAGCPGWVPDDVRDAVVELALEEADLSPRELAVRFTDTQKYFVSEASVYRKRPAQSDCRRAVDPQTGRYLPCRQTGGLEPQGILDLAHR